MSAAKKTNAARALDALGIAYDRADQEQLGSSVEDT